MNAFPPGVKDNLLNYVYVYVDPTNEEIFYVGKGKGDRCFAHLSEKKDGDKVERIKKIKAIKLEPRIDVLAFGLDEISAHRVEAAAIDLVGIKNLTNLQRGHGSDAYGRKTLDDLIALFHAKEIKQFDENIALIRLNRTYRSGMPPAELYEYTRGRWKISEQKRNAVQYACAVYEGVERLYLVGLSAHKSYEEILSLSDVFPSHDKVFAHWFTGELRCPQGTQLEYRHMGYGSIYEYDLLMDFKQGVLINKHARHNEVPKPKDEKDYPSFLRRGAQ
jgi:hypothetical protein